MDFIIEILEELVKKNGEVALTNKDLLDIVKLAITLEERKAKAELEGHIENIY